MDLEEVELLGGEGRIVAIDEASASRRKYKRRVLPNNSVRILGGVEIGGAGGGESTDGGRPKREEAGRRFLLQVPDLTRVAPGALIWTDSLKSYERLPTGGLYVLEKANRNRGEWVGEKGQAASAIDGLWSRAKRNLRLASTRKLVGNDYAPLLGEFIWRMRAARGRERRRNVFRGGQEAGFKRTRG